MAKPFQAGILRDRITFKQLADTRNGTGKQNTSWVTFRTLSGSLTPYRAGGETQHADRETAVFYHQIRLRRPSAKGILPSMRAECDGRTFEIDDVQLISTAEVRIICREVKPGAIA